MNKDTVCVRISGVYRKVHAPVPNDLITALVTAASPALRLVGDEFVAPVDAVYTCIRLTSPQRVTIEFGDQYEPVHIFRESAREAAVLYEACVATVVSL